MYKRMSNCEYKSIIQYIIDNKQFVIKHKPTESNYYESEYYQQQYVYYTFQISFEQNDVLLTLYEYDNEKILQIHTYVFATHQAKDKGHILSNKIGIDNSIYQPCNNAWKWILPFVKKMGYMIYGV